MTASNKYYIHFGTFTILFLFGWLSITSFTPFKKDIEFKITPEFDSYLELQKLWIKAEIFNHSDKDYKLSMPFSVYDGILFDIVDENGKKYNSLILSHFQQTYSYDTLQSGASKESSGDLEVYFGISNLPVGKFKITAYYQNLRSNTIILNVDAPQGAEKEVRDAYLENLRQRFDLTLDRSSYDLDQYDKYLRDLMEKYPGSKYIPEMFQLMILNIATKSIEYVENECVFKFLDKYCNYYSARIILAIYKSYLQRFDPKQVSEKLIYIRDMYPQTFTSEFTQVLIDVDIRKRLKVQ